MTKLTKKLLLSIMTLVLVFMALGTTTFAWFSMNSEVTVKGFKVQTKVGNNLFIAADAMDETAVKGDSAWKTYLDEDIESADYLEPASTINGYDFFYTVEAESEGQKISSASYKQYDPEATEDTFNDAYAMGDDEDAVPYVDYTFQLKAVNTSKDTASYINLKEMNLVYTGDYKDADGQNIADVLNSLNAFRIAIFYEAIVTSTTFVPGENEEAHETVSEFTKANPVDYVEGTDGAKASLLKNSSAAYFTTGQAVGAAGNTTTAYANYLNEGFTSIKVEAGDTVIVKMVVRMWLEGEDTKCNSHTFVNLGEKWVCDFAFEFKPSQANFAFGNIQNNQIDLSATSTVTVSSTDFIELDNVKYYATNVKHLNKVIYVDSTTISADTNAYYIDGGEKHDVTLYCKLPTA